MITIETLIPYWKIGFKPVPLDDLGKNPVLAWSEIYEDSKFWSEEKFEKYLSKFYNIATTFGKSHVRDLEGRDLYLYCLDIDSEEALKRVSGLLEGEWKTKTFVTKTQKDCGYHVYWFGHTDGKIPILTEHCKKGFEFEIKSGKSLCNLPPSRHRDNPLFHYESVGQYDKIMIADGLYERLVDELLQDCVRRKKKDAKLKKQNTSKEEHNSIVSSVMVPNSTPKTVVQNMADDNSKLDDYLINDSSSKLPKVVLTNEQIEKSTQHLMPYYQEGTRDKFTFGFSGLAYKQSIAEESAVKMLENICIKAKDLAEERARLDTLHRTYANGVENGPDGITGKTKLKEVIIHVSNCENIAAENVIQDLLKIWNGDDSNAKNGVDVDRNNNKVTSKQGQSDPKSISSELSYAGITSPSEYAISVINKTVKCDDSLVRAVFYSACSTWTFDPMNLGISAPTSEGKTYTVLQTLQYFPKKDIKYIGSMSPKVIIRQESILVDPDTFKPIQGHIETLKKQIKKEDNEKKKEKLEKELEDLKANARPLIDLRGKIYVFLEPPHPDLWKIIKPIMSHDNFMIEHPYVESNTIQGIHVRCIITLGFPTFIFCTAKDESRWEQWDEIASRSLIMSPNMSRIKYREANILNAQQLGLPTAIQQLMIKSRRQVELARKCILYLKDTIARALITVENGGTSKEK
jgi:hypothetical protein